MSRPPAAPQPGRDARKRRLLAILRAYRAAVAALPDAVVVDRNTQRVLWFNEAATPAAGAALSPPPDASWSPCCNHCRWRSGWRRAQRRAHARRGLAGRPGHAPEPAADPVFRGTVAAGRPRRDPHHAPGDTCAATSSPTSRTSCARRSPWCTATWRCWTRRRCPSGRRCWRRCSGSRKRMEPLVEDLLALSRLEARASCPRNRWRWRRCWPPCAARPRR